MILIGLAAALIFVGGVVVVVLKRQTAKVKSFEDVVQSDVDQARRRLEQIRAWAKAFRTQERTRKLYLDAQQLTIKIEAILRALEENPESHRMIGLHLAALSTIEETLRGFAEAMRTLEETQFQEELKKTEQFLEGMDQAYSAKERDLALIDLMRMQGSRAAGQSLLGTSASALSQEEAKRETPEQTGDTRPPVRRSQVN